MLRLMVLFSVLSASALAGNPATWQGQIAGVPAWVTVVPRGHEISSQVRGQPWWGWGNTETDAYLFAFNQPNNVRIILSFETKGGLPEAQLYLNQWGQRPLAYSLQGDQLSLLDPTLPTITVRPEEGGWLVNGRPNYRLTLVQDGLRCDLPVNPDGIPDMEVKVGVDGEGLPLWQTSRRLNDPHPNWGCFRFGVELRMPNSPPFKVAPGLLPGFPYLGIAREATDWFSENPNPLLFDLRKNHLEVNPFTGFQNGGMYVINSNTPGPDVAFESPFIFYNFDPTTRYAHLVVRGLHFPRWVEFGPEPYSLERTSFRYSWKTDEETAWRYSVNVAGFYPYPSNLEVGGEKFKAPSANATPKFVVGQPWPLVTFVEATRGYPGSEGIYFYTSQSDAHWDWLSGSVDRPTPEFEAPYLPEGDDLVRTSDRALPRGFRGEYSAAYFQKPTLYLSPFDGQLHLLNAQGGLWNLGAGRVLRYHRLGQAPYVNGWTRERVPSKQARELGEPIKALPGTLEEALYALEGYLLYAGPQGVEIRRATYRLADTPLAPPTDRQSWQAFRQRVRGLAPRDPQNLRGWLEGSPGPGIVLPGARFEGVRLIPQGLRLTLTLAAPFAGGQGLPALAAGRQILEYNRTRGWSRQTATPARLEVALENRTVQQYTATPLRLTLRNVGSLDWSGPVEVWAGDTLLKTWPQLNIAGGQSWSEEVAFAASHPGPQQLTLRVEGRILAQSPLEVLPNPRPDPWQTFRLSSSQPWLLAVILLLGMIGLWRVWRPL